MNAFTKIQNNLSPVASLTEANPDHCTSRALRNGPHVRVSRYMSGDVKWTEYANHSYPMIFGSFMGNCIQIVLEDDKFILVGGEKLSQFFVVPHDGRWLVVCPEMAKVNLFGSGNQPSTFLNFIREVLAKEAHG